MIRPVFRSSILAAVAVGIFAPTQVAAQSAEQLALQREQYDAVRAKTVLELQPFRNAWSADVPGTGQKVVLTSLNPGVGAWYLLQITDEAAGRVETFHIEHPFPTAQAVTLDPAGPMLRIVGPEGVELCAPWNGELADARKSAQPYAPICNGRLYVRNKTRGSRTNLEATAQFLRDNVWGGETLVRCVRAALFKDSQLETGKVLSEDGVCETQDGPPPMKTEAAEGQRPVIGTLLDITVTGAERGRMAVGLWYPVTGLEGVYASAFQPRAIAKVVLSGPGKTKQMDAVEAKATGYMVAFDMSLFGLGFAMGTDHPSLGWSPRPAASARPRGLPGPDGIKAADPLVLFGMVSPATANRTVATFTGGFKRRHGAFKFGEMATFNMGHHYGFIENGVILSKLQPGLSTILVLSDGSVRMKTWRESDKAMLPLIRFARQNGVPLLETDPQTGQGVPGDKVTRWGPGNWSGSADGELRSLRAGACMVKDDDTEYLVYGYFSAATPSAMARTFQAYGCRYAMLLDMNALEHTYLALYVPREGEISVEHIVPGMGLIDKKARDGSVIPRFIGFPDNRDVFFVTWREARE